MPKTWKFRARSLPDTAWTCFRCRDAVADRDLFIVHSDTGEAIVLHRRCVTLLLNRMEPDARAQAKRQILKQSKKGH